MMNLLKKTQSIINKRYILDILENQNELNIRFDRIDAGYYKFVNDLLLGFRSSNSKQNVYKGQNIPHRSAHSNLRMLNNLHLLNSFLCFQSNSSYSN